MPILPSGPVKADLLAAFRSRRQEERLVVELLAVADDRLKTAEAVRLCSGAGLVAPSGRRYAKTTLGQLFRRLRVAGLLKPVRTAVEVDRRFAEVVTREVTKQGRLQRHWNALRRFDPLQDPKDPRYWKDTRRESWNRRLRLAVHSNDRDLFARMKALPLLRTGRRAVSRGDVRNLFDRCFDPEWILSRIPEIRDEGLSDYLRTEVWMLSSSGEGSDLARRVAGRPDASQALWDIAVKRDLLRGDLLGANNLLAADRWGAADLFRGWIDCISGNRERAIERFRRTLGVAPIKEDEWFAPFYVLALIGTGDVDCLSEAARFVDRAFPARIDSGLGRAFRSVLERAEGKAESARAGAKGLSWGRMDSDYPVGKFFGTLAEFWCDREAMEDGESRAFVDGLFAYRCGYEWLAAEYRKIAILLEPDRAKSKRLPPPSKLVSAWHVPLADSLVTVPGWRVSVAALAGISSKAGRKRKKARQKPAKRLAWLVEITEDGPWLEAREQTRGRTGKWSKGRKVATERLVEGRGLRSLTAQDWEVCDAIFERYRNRWGRWDYDFAGAFGALVGHPNVRRMDSPATEVEIVGVAPQVQISSKGAEILIKLVPPPPKSGDTLVDAESPTRIAVTVFDRRQREIYGVLGPKGLRVPAGDSRELVPAIDTLSKLVTVESDVPGILPAGAKSAGNATPVLQVTSLGDGLRIVPVVRPFGSKGPFLPTGSGSPTVVAHIGGRGQSRKRNLPLEKKRLAAVVSKCRSLGDANWDGAQWVVDGIGACLELLDELRAVGKSVRLAWPKGEKLRVRHRASPESLSMRIRTATDWFGFDGKLKVDSGLVLSLRELLDAMENASGRFVPLGGNQFLALTEEFRQRLDVLSGVLVRTPKFLRMPTSRAHMLEDGLEDVGSVRSDAGWKAQLKQMRDGRALEPDVPSTLQAELRHYQADGFRWAARLAAWGAGACLADDMGLGKTMQALAVILNRAASGPALVVAPTSVCSNWIDEARRFAPTLRPVRFGAGDRRAMLESAGPFDLIVCSYGLLLNEADLLAEAAWETLVLDEAQAIKNMETQRWKASRKLSAGFRMITTGTPIENHLGELYSLFEFLNPGLLGKPKEFHSKFAHPIHQHGDQTARSRLRRFIRPFILRRTKSAVLDELPPKTEVTLRIEMSPKERAFYEAVRQRALDALADGGFGHMRILAQITRLRQACCNPLLLAPETDIRSSKLGTFMDTVVELVASRHKALVFSQFVSHLSILRSELDREGIGYRYLDGSTPAHKRKQEIDAFQAGEGDLFLISLRAGGQGLNLTAADYVIHMDPWWNPAVEDQASDRAHRIGQTRPVTIYRLVMRDTIEEKIVDLHARKRELADRLLAGTEMAGRATADELLALMREI